MTDGPFAANGHMVQKAPRWRASCALGHAKTKRLHPVTLEVSLFWISQCVACSPGKWILYHVTVSCKRPIRNRRRQLAFLAVVTFWSVFKLGLPASVRFLFYFRQKLVQNLSSTRVEYKWVSVNHS